MEPVIHRDDAIALGGRFDVRVTVLGERTAGVMSVIEEALPPRALVPPHVHRNDVWVQVLSGELAVLVGDRTATARTGDWALKPRDVPHGMWNPTDQPVHVMEVLTPSGT
jgi:quercetin dioxygenase-like cupin family protein